jgi:hypothetical protein
VDYSFIFLILFLTAAMALVYYVTQAGKKKHLERQQSEQRKLDAYLKELVASGERLERDGIPAIDSEISLRRGEALYVVLRNIQWCEYRKVRTGRVSGHGVTGRIRLAKGLYYRYGTGQMKAETMDQLSVIDSGDLYFTNKGVLFRGRFGNKNLPYPKVQNIIPLMQGLQIERESGKNVYIPCDTLGSRPQYGATIALLWDKARK